MILVPLSGIRPAPYYPVVPLSGTHRIALVGHSYIESHCLNGMLTRPRPCAVLIDGRQIRSRGLRAAQLAKGWSAQLHRAHLLGSEQEPLSEPSRRR